MLLCLSGQEMVPTGQRPLLKDSWRQKRRLWEEQLVDPLIAYTIFYNNVNIAKLKTDEHQRYVFKSCKNFLSEP